MIAATRLLDLIVEIAAPLALVFSLMLRWAYPRAVQYTADAVTRTTTHPGDTESTVGSSKHRRHRLVLSLRFTAGFQCPTGPIASDSPTDARSVSPAGGPSIPRR
jgi:hypothetical protein